MIITYIKHLAVGIVRFRAISTVGFFVLQINKKALKSTLNIAARAISSDTLKVSLRLQAGART